MKPNKIFFSILLCLTSLSAIAADPDLLQKLEIKADNQSADIKNKQVIYSGHVLVNQGSMKLTADEVNASSSENETERVLIAKGNPATFVKKMEDGHIAHASANEIHYNVQKRILTLIGKASVEQDGSMSTADKIVYDLQKQQLQASSSGQGNDRVTTVIQPENFQQPESKQEQQ